MPKNIQNKIAIITIILLIPLSLIGFVLADCEADLAVSKMDDPDPVVAGEPLTYTITITNNGPTTLTEFTLTDDIPDELLNPVLTESNGTYDPSSHTWSGITLDAGEEVTLTITGTVNPEFTGSTISNTVTVATPEGFPDLFSGNNEATQTTTCHRQADLAVTKADSADPVKANDPLNYTITVTNNGPSTILATDTFTLKDTLPAGFTATSYTPGAGDYNSNNGAWTGVKLAKGESVTLSIAGTVEPGIGDLTNIATVIPPSGVTDPVLGNNEAKETTTVNREANLAITKKVDNARPNVKDTIHYTMIVNNNGPDTAVDVQVADKMPEGLSFVRYETNYGAYDPDTGIWSIGNLPRGERAEITITSVVEKSGIIINEAKVESIITDPNLDDNTARATIIAQQKVFAASESIGMQKTGLPIAIVITAVLAIFCGFIAPKRK